MDVSFVIPALNESELIADTLRPLQRFQARTSLSVEIIVVDGGSTDNTADIATAYADRILHEPTTPGTIARARNLGGFAATGDVLIHMDADSRVPFLDELVHRVVRDVADGHWVAATVPLRPYPWDRSWRDDLAHGSMNCGVRICLRFGGLFAKGEFQAMSRRAFQNASGYNENLCVGEDCDLFRRLGHDGRLVFLSDYSVYHSVRRFRRYGYAHVFATYFREAFWLAVFKRNYLRSWVEVR